MLIFIAITAIGEGDNMSLTTMTIPLAFIIGLMVLPNDAFARDKNATSQQNNRNFGNQGWGSQFGGNQSWGFGNQGWGFGNQSWGRSGNSTSQQKSIPKSKN